MPSKGSRRIEVDGVAYRWRIRRKGTHCQTDYGNGCLTVAIDVLNAPGTTLVLRTGRPHPQGYGFDVVVPVVPADVANWIRQALCLGWIPAKRGPQFRAFVGECVALERQKVRCDE